MVIQHPHSASLPLTFTGLVRWQSRLNQDRCTYANAIATFDLVSDTSSNIPMISCSILLGDIEQSGIIAMAQFQLAIADSVVPGRQYLYDYTHRLIRMLIRMNNDVNDDMITLQ